jgi:hypothetical protein
MVLHQVVTLIAPLTVQVELLCLSDIRQCLHYRNKNSYWCIIVMVIWNDQSMSIVGNVVILPFPNRHTFYALWQHSYKVLVVCPLTTSLKWRKLAHNCRIRTRRKCGLQYYNIDHYHNPFQIFTTVIYLCDLRHHYIITEVISLRVWILITLTC